jgi:RimJ/RimL family protein N-acetyltransferase
MMLAFPNLPLHTSRLSLRPFRPGDFEAYAGYHARPDVYRYLYSAPPGEEELRSQFETARKDDLSQAGDTLRLAVERKSDVALLGEVLLKIADTAALQGEIGYIFDPRHAGAGYATEATGAMLAAGFRDIGFHRIFARIDTQNQPSVRLAERLGLRREAHFVENDRFEGRWGDEFVYAMLAREWHALR